MKKILKNHENKIVLENEMCYNNFKSRFKLGLPSRDFKKNFSVFSCCFLLCIYAERGKAKTLKKGDSNTCAV